MKLASVIIGGRATYGLVTDDGLIDLGRRFGPACGTLRQFLAAGRLAEAKPLSRERADHALADVAFAPVIPDPDKILCVGLNYRDHVAETGRTVTDKPTIFARFPQSQVGHLQPLVRPKVSTHFDYEGELAVVIGIAGRHIAPDQALRHVAGYACYNEGSIRDWQRHTSQFMPGKTFERSGSFGPYLVTTDEIPDPSKLSLETRLNGEVVQRTTTDLMITNIPDLIAYCSAIMTLLPGDVIVTGTPGGVGFKRSPPLFMKPGDVAEVEISAVGLLRNWIVDEAT